MNEREATWIVVVGDHGTRLMRGWASGSGRNRRLRLEQVDELENAWSALEQPPGPSEADPERGSERLLRLTEFRQRYAGEVGRWLGEMAHSHGFGDFELFAPPRLTVMLRRELPPDLAQQVHEHRVDFGNLRLERLEAQSELFGLLRSEAG